MIISLELYKPGKQFSTIPILFTTNIIISNQLHINDLYQEVVSKLQNNPPPIFRGRSIKLTPISFKYFAGLDGRIVKVRLPFFNNFDLSYYHTPQQLLHGKYNVTFVATYTLDRKAKPQWEE